MNTTFVATHEIIFTPVTGAPRTILVALTDDGAAYTREEWESETAADWECRDGEWRCQGQTTPGGANGTVEVRRLGWLDTLIAAGHATRTPGKISRPVTTAGYYDTDGGWFVRVWWRNGINHTDEAGYSAAYRNAVEEAEREHGAWGPDNDAEVEAAVRARLGLH